MTDLKKYINTVSPEKIEPTELKPDKNLIRDYINAESKVVSNPIIAKIYEPINLAVNKIINGYSYLTLVKGLPGVGKSAMIKLALESSQVDYAEFTGDVTPAYLYRILFENNGKIIWLKDISRILKNSTSLNLLKVSTETEKTRTLTKSTYSKVQSDLPDRFEFTGRLILDYNSTSGIPTGCIEDFEALKSRGDFIEISLSPTQLRDILYSIADTDWKKEVTEFILNNFNINNGVRLNLRTQYKAFKTYEYAKTKNIDWKELVLEQLSSYSDTKKMLLSLIGDEPIKIADLKRLLINHRIVNSIETARRRINAWIELSELIKVTAETQNFIVKVKT